MKAYCYHVRVPGNSPDEELALIDVWRRSWTKAGWLPVVLNESHAQQHPKFHYYRDKFRALPTVNNSEYEVACFMRWVAMACVGGGLLTDYDLINYGFAPRAPDPQQMAVITYGEGGFIGCVMGVGAHFQRMADIFSEWTPGASDVDNGRPYCSDMPGLKAVSTWTPGKARVGCSKDSNVTVYALNPLQPGVPCLPSGPVSPMIPSSKSRRK